MPAEITETDSLFSVRQLPWHGLGEVLEDYPSRQQAQKIAHPWEPIEEPIYRKVPMVTEDDDGGFILEERFVEIEGSKLVARSDTAADLGVVNTSFTLINNSEMWDIAEVLQGTHSDVMFETAGSLRGGRDVWILIRLNEPLKITGDPQGDTLAMFSLQNSHTAEGAFRGQAHNTRIVCANTSAAADASAKASGHEFRFRHSSGIRDRIEEAKAAVELWRSDVDEWQNVMEHLITARVTEDQATEFVERFQPMPPEHLTTERVRENVMRARKQLREILAGPTQADISQTAYGLFQGALEWSQHVRATKGTDDRIRMENHFRRAVMNDGGLRRSTLNLVRDVASV